MLAQIAKKKTHPKEPTVHADFLELLGREVEVQVDPLVSILCARPTRAQTCGTERRARIPMQACVSVSLIKSVCVLGHSYDRSSPFESSCGYVRRCKRALFGCYRSAVDCCHSVRIRCQSAAQRHSAVDYSSTRLRSAATAVCRALNSVHESTARVCVRACRSY